MYKVSSILLFAVYNSQFRIMLRGIAKLPAWRMGHFPGLELQLPYFPGRYGSISEMKDNTCEQCLAAKLTNICMYALFFSWDVEDKIEMHRYYQWCKHIGDMNKSGISDNPLPFTHKPLENKYI